MKPVHILKNYLTGPISCFLYHLYYENT